MGSQRLTAIPNALIKVLEGLVCAGTRHCVRFLHRSRIQGDRIKVSGIKRPRRAGGLSQESHSLVEAQLKTSSGPNIMTCTTGWGGGEEDPLHYESDVVLFVE